MTAGQWEKETEENISMAIGLCSVGPPGDGFDSYKCRACECGGGAAAPSGWWQRGPRPMRTRAVGLGWLVAGSRWEEGLG